MTLALNTSITISSAPEGTWPSQAMVTDGVLQSRRRVAENPILNDAANFLDSGISRELLAGAYAGGSTRALGAELAEWVRFSSKGWEELCAAHDLVFVVGVDSETRATGPTSSGSELRETRQEAPVRSLSEIADELTADVSDSEWDRIPTDLVKNLDHYLYGAPKDEE